MPSKLEKSPVILIQTHLIANNVPLVSNEDFIPAQNRQADVGIEAESNLVKWICSRPKTVAHGSSMVKPQFMVIGLWLGSLVPRTVTTK